MEIVVKKYITGIKVKEKGIKGLEINFCHQEEKDGKTWNIPDWQDRKMPVGEKLMDVIKAFRYYLMDIYGYDSSEANVADVTIKEISFDGPIKIIGEMRVLNGDRTVPLKSCKMDADVQYEKQDELEGLVRQLKDEVQDYMDGKSIMTERQLVMTFYAGKKGFDEAKLAGMSEEEIRDYHTQALEKMGSIVIHDEDVATDDNFTAEDEQEEKEEETSSEKEPVKEQGKIITPNFSGAPVEQPKVEEPKTDLITGEDDDEEMVLQTTPIVKVN